MVKAIQSTVKIKYSCWLRAAHCGQCGEIAGSLKFNCRSKSKLQTQSLPSCDYWIVVYPGAENKWGVILAHQKQHPLLFYQKIETGNRFYLNHYLHLWSVLCRFHVDAARSACYAHLIHGHFSELQTNAPATVTFSFSKHSEMIKWICHCFTLIHFNVL